MHSLIAISPSDVNAFINGWAPTVALVIFVLWTIYWVFTSLFGKDNDEI